MLSKIIPINQEMSPFEIFWIHQFNLCQKLEHKAEIIHYLFTYGHDHLAESLNINCTGISVNLNMYIGFGETITELTIQESIPVPKPSKFKKIIRKVYSLTKILF